MSKPHPIKHALLIEDHRAPAIVAQYLLEKVGYDVKWVETGEEGLEEIQTGYYDILLSDIGLPGISGLEVAKRCRELGITLPIFAVSDRIRIPLEEYRAAGFDALLIKPLEMKRFIAFFNEFANGQQEVSPKLIDIEQALQKSQYTKSFLFDLLRLYNETLLKEITSLKAAAKTNNREKISDILHDLRDGAAYCYLTHLLEVTKKVHTEIMQNKNEDINTILAPFYSAAEKTMAEIKRITGG